MYKIEDEKHELLLRLPEYIHKILVRYKKLSGVSITNYIYKAIMREMIMDGLVSLETIKNNNVNKKEKKQVVVQPIPEELKFCNGDSCGITPDS